ncbi:Centrosomal protein of 131 kDa [Hondaea fermentalgiana]|uniref:Centrosomal protein of 131 kDa n=1 Tax=Hondaea fermentalgiana TaxID=2315210 RepID=A0A2R5G9T7_9STRA|nr:Centrosomal protein of 131 kDa [Hondaea fermentalgiana]|eukprot:GBG27780.1 Centrosomal protein of 131 kDa [Hondaea fermentalgiana]
MVSRKLRKENLTDSLKLNRERLASTPRHDDVDRVKTMSARSKNENSMRESKYEDDAENLGSRENHSKPRIAFAEKPPKVVRATETGIKDELFSFLDEAAASAAGERDATISRLGYKEGAKRYDWEVDEENEEDEHALDMSGNDDSVEAADDIAEVSRGLTPSIESHPISKHMRAQSSNRNHGSHGPSRSRKMREGVRRIPAQLDEDDETRSHFAADSPMSRATLATGGMRSASASSMGTSSTSARYSSLKLELEDKRKTIEALKQALERTRREKAEAAHKAAAATKEGMERQRAEHEQAVARHLGFIDKLLADKKQLAAKVEELASRIKRGEEDMARKMRDTEEKHARELSRVKDTMAAADAAKRQRWQKEKTKELKELTIKGLEPEVQSILAKHKDDLRVIEDRFKDEARAIRDAQEREKERALAELRARHLSDLEEVRSGERTSMLGKLRQMEERHQEDLQAQRARLEGEFEDLRKRHREELREAQDALKQRVADAARQRESELEVEKRRLEAQLEGLEQKWALEKEQWQARVVRKLEEKAATEERKLREKLTAQRDKQIDAVIGKLYAEQESKAAEKDSELRESIRAAEARAEAAAREAEAEAAEWRAKFERLRNTRQAEKQTFSSAEARVRDLERQAEARERRIVELSAKTASTNDLLAEREQQIRAEYAERNANQIRRQAELQDRVEAAHEELARERAARKKSETELQANFEEETAEIHRRVRATLARKDETIRAMRAQIEDMEARFATYDELLEKQRQDFVGGSDINS